VHQNALVTLLHQSKFLWATQFTAVEQSARCITPWGSLDEQAAGIRQRVIRERHWETVH
jgi:hypothetical protein